MDPVVCEACGARIRADALTENERRAIYNQRCRQRLADELRMLLKVKAYYRRHPGAEGRIKPHHTRVLSSVDPAVRDLLHDGVPFDQIKLPQESLPAAWVADSEDEEVVDYLSHNDFALGPRMEFVTQALLSPAEPAVACRHCDAGRLYVADADWDEFAAVDAT